jgi:hypothetical protein
LEVSVEPHIDTLKTFATTTIATSMQIVGNSKLQLNHPADPYTYMKNHFIGKGWTVEDVE